LTRYRFPQGVFLQDFGHGNWPACCCVSFGQLKWPFFLPDSNDYLGPEYKYPMNQYKKLPACLSFLPTFLTIILCFLFTGTSAEPADANVSRSVNDTAPAKYSENDKINCEEDIEYDVAEN